jgi:tight adherence protein C
MFRTGRLLLIGALVAALLPLQLLAGSPAAADDGAKIVVTQVDVSAFPDVRFLASVNDAQGRPLPGLSATDLVLSENGAAQTAAIELASQVAPVALAIVLDVSGSMGGRPIADAKQAITTLINGLGPQDQAAFLTFDTVVRVDRPLTSNKAALVAATNAAVAGGDTAIYDALSAAIGALDQAPPKARKAIVLLTDGIDNSSRASAASVLARLASATLPVNVVGLGTDLDRGTLTAISAAAPGGRFLEAPSSTQLGAIYAGLTQQLLTQYSVRYRSAAAVPDNGEVTLSLALRRDGALLATTAVTYRVPAGRGVPPPTTAPAPAVVATPVPAVKTVVVAQKPLISAELVGLLGAATVLTLLLWILELSNRYPARQRRRLEVFVRGLSLTTASHAKRRSLVQRVIVPTLRTAGRPLMRVTPGGVVNSARDRLAHAGDPVSLGAVEFLGVQAGVALLGAIVGLGIVTSLTGNPAAAPLGVLAGILFGYVVPGIVLDTIGRRRKTAIGRALPAALDMLALSAEAGLSFDGAIGQVAHRWDTPLSDEFRRVLVEFQMGRERRHALRELAQRTGVPELARFASAVVQADSLGVPLSQVLHEQSIEIRMRRRQKAEEAARKAPVKMLFPMVLLIFPALFVVVLGPAVPRLLDAFGGFK